MSAPPRDTIRAARAGPASKLSVEHVPAPRPGPGEVVVRVSACGICGSDLHAVRSARWPEGLVPGHEIAGRIEALGADVDRGGGGATLAEGQSVVVEPLESCGECAECLAGRDSRCPTLRIKGVHEAGGFAECVVARASRVYPIDPAIDPATATLVEPLAVALHALDRVPPVRGQRVLVIGGGTLGLLSAFAALDAGAAEVDVRARYPHQAELARRLGVTRTHDAARDLAEDELTSAFDVVVETVGGESRTLLEAGEAARPGGSIVVLGLFDGAPALDPWLALEKELGLFWSNCYHTAGEPDFLRATRLLARNADTLGQLVTERRPLEGIDEALGLAADKMLGISRVVVIP